MAPPPSHSIKTSIEKQEKPVLPWTSNQAGFKVLEKTFRDPSTGLEHFNTHWVFKHSGKKLLIIKLSTKISPKILQITITKGFAAKLVIKIAKNTKLQILTNLLEMA